MKSIDRRVLAKEERRPLNGFITNFNAGVKDQHFSRDRIGRGIKRLMPKEEYEELTGSAKRQIVAYAYALSWGLNRTAKEGQSALGGVENREAEPRTYQPYDRVVSFVGDFNCRPCTAL